MKNTLSPKKYVHKIVIIPSLKAYNMEAWLKQCQISPLVKYRQNKQTNIHMYSVFLKHEKHTNANISEQYKCLTGWWPIQKLKHVSLFVLFIIFLFAYLTFYKFYGWLANWMWHKQYDLFLNSKPVTLLLSIWWIGNWYMSNKYWYKVQTDQNVVSFTFCQISHGIVITFHSWFVTWSSIFLQLLISVIYWHMSLVCWMTCLTSLTCSLDCLLVFFTSTIWEVNERSIQKT